MNPHTQTLTDVSRPTETLPPLSQSRYELMACGHLYAERSVLRTPQAPNEFSERGIIIHRVLGDYIDHLVATRRATDLEKYDEMIIGVTGDARDILDGLRNALVIDPERVVGTEMYLAANDDFQPVDPMDAAGPWDYEGTLDLVLAPNSTTIEIWDWKSFFQIIDADTFQSKLYPLLAFLHFPGVETVRFQLKFVRYGATRSVEYTRTKDLPKLLAEARAQRVRQRLLHEEVLRGTELEPMPGSHCCYCPKLTSGCPIASINPYTSQTPEERTKFGAWLLAAKKENDSILKAHVNANGPVKITDGNGNVVEAAFSLQQKNKYPLTPCLPVIQENDPELLGKAYISNLSSYLKTKKRTALREALAEYRVSTAQTRFSIRGGVDEDEQDDE